MGMVGAANRARRSAVSARWRARGEGEEGSARGARRTTSSAASRAHWASAIAPRSALSTADSSNIASHAISSSSLQSPLKDRLTRTYAESALTQCQRSASGASLPPLNLSNGSKASSALASGGMPLSLSFAPSLVVGSHRSSSATARSPLALARVRPASGDSHPGPHASTSSPLAPARSQLARSSSFNASKSNSPPARSTSKLASLSTHRSPPSSSSSSPSSSSSSSIPRSSVPSATARRRKVSIISRFVSAVAVIPRIALASASS